MIEVSIIIINYNTRTLTNNCIRSVEEKVKGVSYEIILVDNASTEADPEFFRHDFPNILLVKSQSNLGFAGGNNLGILHASGKYILLLNNDTVLLNDAVSITLDKMKETQVSVAACKVYNEDRTIQPTIAFFPSARFSLLAFFGIIQLSRRVGFGKTSFEYDYSAAHKVDWIWGCFLFFNREVLKCFDSTILPQDFFMYGEDMQWCYIWNQKGIERWYFPQGKIVHLFSGNKKSQDPYVNQGFRHHVLFLKRYYASWRYSIIFLMETLTSITRLRFSHLFSKIHLYLTLK